MKNKLKCGLTLAALALLVGCSDKEGIQRPSVGSGSTAQDSSSIIDSETSDSASSEIDPVELSSYQYYPLPDNTWAIAVGNNKYLEKLTLPEQYQGRKVTQIAEDGFKDCRALREIGIPSSVLTIGDRAFSGCSALSNIVIPEGVTAIGDRAFDGCTSLTGIVIPQSVTAIGGWAFDGCSRLTICCQAQSKPSGWSRYWNESNRPVVWGCSGIGASGSLNYRIDYKNGEESIAIIGYAGTDSEATIPETIGGAKVTAIADSAFKGCSSLKGVAIPNGVTAIGAGAFYGCTSLTSVAIPNSVTSIGGDAFYGCSGLTICCQAQSKPSGWSDYWNNKGYGSRYPVIWGCIRAGNQDCFEYAVISIEGAESATIIGYAGSDASVAVPETMGGAKVAAIADSAFKGRSSLTGVVIPQSVTAIGGWAFDGCTSLTGIVIPNSVTAIGDRAFYGCTSLTGIVIPQSVTAIGGWAFDGCSRLTICCQAQSKPSGWSDSWNPSNRPVVWGYSGIGASDSLNYRIDYKNGEKSITITGYAGIDSEATIPETIGGVKVTAIADSAFKGCSSLKGIAIPEGVTSIGGDAFYGCSSLTSIVIPNGVTAIGAGAFSGCSALSNIVIPSSVTSIGGDAFYGCSSLTSVAIPSSVTAIGAGTFRGCASLASIVIPDGVTTIGDYAFSGCSALSNIVISQRVTAIGAGTFRGCASLASIVIPDGVTTIGDFAFEGCSALASINIPEGVTTIGNATFSGCTSLTSVAIPSSVTAIGAGAFYGCTSLTSVAIPSSVTAIGAGAFYGCSSLTSIVIPNGVTNIGDFAFKGCSALASINIPEGVTNIGDRAFSGCSRLTIYCQAQSKPSGWSDSWNPSNRPVVWGYSGNETSGSLDCRIDNKNGEESTKGFIAD